MARTAVAKPTNFSIKCMVFFLLVGCVSSQNCTDPLLSKCICTEQFFLCQSANLTAFPTDVPNKETIIHIRVTNNSIPVIDSDILSGFTQLQTVALEDNGLTRIVNQSLPANLTTVILSNNPVICNASLLWLTMVPNVVGHCASGVQIATFLETLKPTPTAIDGDTTQQAPVTDIVTETTSFTTVGITLAPATNKLYILAIIIPILVLVFICTVIVVFSIRKNHQQKEAYNSSIRYSVVRKDVGAGNRVYSDVTTEL